MTRERHVHVRVRSSWWRAHVLLGILVFQPRLGTTARIRGLGARGMAGTEDQGLSVGVGLLLTCSSWVSAGASPSCICCGKVPPLRSVVHTYMYVTDGCFPVGKQETEEMRIGNRLARS